jgi:hypothetical protein
MFEECAYLYDDGRKCRRIPKRGQKLCPAHRSRARRRLPLEENEAFRTQLSAFVDRLEAMPLQDLLYATTEVLADIHALVDRRSSRRDRIAFSRATAALGVSADRLEETLRSFRNPQQPGPASPAQSSTPTASTGPLSPENRASFAEAAKALEVPLSREQLGATLDRLLSILNSNAGTTSTLNANT